MRAWERRKRAGCLWGLRGGCGSWWEARGYTHLVRTCGDCVAVAEAGGRHAGTPIWFAPVGTAWGLRKLVEGTWVHPFRSHLWGLRGGCGSWWEARGYTHLVRTTHMGSGPRGTRISSCMAVLQSRAPRKLSSTQPERLALTRWHGPAKARASLPVLTWIGHYSRDPNLASHTLSRPCRACTPAGATCGTRWAPCCRHVATP